MGNRPGMDATTARELGASPNLARLEELDLGQTGFPIEAWDEVLKWPCLPRLQWLRLCDSRVVNPPSCMTVANLKKMTDYRGAFEAKVGKVDWESQFITPWDGNASWKGQSWDGRKEQVILSMWSFIQRRAYAELEAAYRLQCEQYAGEGRPEPSTRYPSRAISLNFTMDCSGLLHSQGAKVRPDRFI
jgi:hypothetical protein